MNSPSTDREQRLNEVLAGYLEAVEVSGAPDRQQLLAQYPDLADELEAFFANHDHLARLSSPAETLSLPGAPSESGRPRLRYFGDYELLEELARGGMGVIYRARQVSLNREVALKMILAGQFASESDIRRFNLEAEAAANLDHPHIVPLYEIGEHEGQQYFSMKLVTGGSLKDHLPSFTADQQATARLMATIARAVHHAHQRGLLHRDLKPANILIADGGWRMADSQTSSESAIRNPQSAIPMITDFGLAKRMASPGREPGETGLTQTGAIVGTPSYMAPEQAAGRKGVSTAADVHSLGAILYEMLTGQPPFQAESPMDTLLQVLEHEPQPPRLLDLRIDSDLETICLKCLEKDPAMRYGSAQALAEDLERWLAGEPIEARPAGEAEKLWRWCRRNPKVAGLTAAVALLLVAFVIGALVALVHIDEEREATFWALSGTEGMRLTAQSEVVRPTNPGQALLLAIQGAALHPDLLANNALLAAIEACAERRTFVGHSDALFSADLSSDGQRVLSWSVDQTARIWDAGTGKELARLQHDAPVVFGRFSPDGTRVLTIASRNYTLDHRGFASGGVAGETAARIWDAATGELLASWKDPGNENKNWAGRHHKSNYVGSFSRDGRWVVTTFGVYPDCPPQVHVADTGKKLAVLTGHAGPVLDVAFHPDGRRILTASLDGTVRLWEASTGKQLHQWTSPDGGVISAVFSPDGGSMLAVSDGLRHSYKMNSDGSAVGRTSTGINRNPQKPVAARIWDTGNGKERVVLYWPKGIVLSTRKAAFSRDGTLVIRGGCVWDAATGEQRVILTGEHERLQSGWPLTAVYSAAISPNNRWVVTAGEDATAHLWEMKTGLEKAVLRGHDGPIYTAMFSQDSRQLFTASRDHTLRLWDTTAVEPPGPAQGYWPGSGWFALSPDGQRLAAYHDRDMVQKHFVVRVWNTRSGKELSRLSGHEGAILLVAFSPDGRKVATASDDRTARVWDVETGKQLAIFRGHTQGIFSIMFSPDSQHVLTASQDHSGRIWSAATGTQEVVLKGGVVIYSARFSPDGRRVLTTSIGRNMGSVLSFQDGIAARLHDAATGEMIGKVEGYGGCVEFSPDSRGDNINVVVADGQTPFIWSPETGEKRYLKGHDGTVWAAAFSPDGRYVVTASADRTARVWSTTTGKEIAVLKGHQEAVTFVSWSPDGRWIATLGDDKTARIWNGVDLPRSSIARPKQPKSNALRQWITGLRQPKAHSFQSRDAAPFKEYLTLRSPEQEFHRIVFSADGKHLLTQSSNGARLWPIDVLELAKKRKPRELMPEEWERYRLWEPVGARR
jgi:WD40 repeat protein